MLSSRLFDDDPFFAGHREHMRRMDEMFRSPFGFSSGGMLGITDGRHGQQQNGNRQVQHQQPAGALAPTGLIDFGFDNMFQNMRRMMDDMHRTFETAGVNPAVTNGHMYTQQSFMSFSNMGGGKPKVFQASTTTTQAPGGVKETRKMLRDSETGVEKMAVSHHIGERGHVVERRRNRHTGDQEENQEYINLDEEEAPQFGQEWEERTRQARQGLEYRRRGERSERRQAALPAPGKKQSYRDRE